MRMRTKAAAVALTFLALAWFGSRGARADVVIDNLNQMNNGTDVAVTNEGNVFTTGNVAEPLQDVVLIMRNLLGQATDVSIFSSVGGVPGKELVSFGAIAPTLDGDNQYLLIPHTPFMLAANTQYFLLAAYAGVPVLDFTNSTTFTGSGVLNGYAESADGGVTYKVFPIKGGVYLMRIDAVPEPSAFALLGVGAVGFTGITLRRRSRDSGIGKGCVASSGRSSRS